MAKGPVLLQLLGVSKRFGAVQAVKPMDLIIEPGELLALLGPSGCGKTTTLRMIAGFEIPDTGSVLLDKEDVTEASPNKRGLGMVFQNYSLFPHMTVGENVAFGLKMHGVGVADRTRRVREILDVVQLSGYEDRYSHQLSGGQQQRVALARALVTNPSVLLLDEPLGALDKNLREGMQFELRQLQRRLQITSVLVTHDQEEALTMSDRVAVMNAGEIAQVGDPVTVYQRPQTRFVAEFLGTANIFQATVSGEAQPGTWKVRVGAEGAEALASGRGSAPLGQSVMIAVRPERMTVVGKGNGAIPARIRDRVFRGSYYVYELEVPGRAEPVIAYRQAQDAGVDDGAEVALTWASDSAVVLADRAP